NTITGNTISSNAQYGIRLHGWNNNNTITGNTISNNWDGIDLYESSSNTITGNTISLNNRYGIHLEDSSNNTIQKNNFINNKRHAFFFNCKNTWKQNYWNRPRILPKLIFGKVEIGSTMIPWINIDWRPALKPYDIGV
ncbi:MAG: right-handed parallel beta-helix repeat-containing protein, partial [Thermoplasmatales archaeon]